MVCFTVTEENFAFPLWSLPRWRWNLRWLCYWRLFHNILCLWFMQSVACLNVDYFHRSSHTLDISDCGCQLSLNITWVVYAYLPRAIQNQRVSSWLLLLTHEVKLAALSTLIEHQWFYLHLLVRPLWIHLYKWRYNVIDWKYIKNFWKALDVFWYLMFSRRLNLHYFRIWD